MLVLAGVSINAIIGDNGVITNAQNAQIAQSCAALEEWLQEKYVDEASDELVSGGVTRNTFVKIEK